MRSRPLTSPLLLLVASLAPATAAHSSENWRLDALAAIATEFVDRGVSQSDGKGVAQGKLDWQHDTGFHAGVWGSTVDFRGEEHRADAEINFMIGFEGEFERWRYATRFTRIRYVAATGAFDDSFFELSGNLEHDAGALQLTAETVFAPNSLGHPGDALYVTVGIGRRLSDTFLLDAHVGRQWFWREDLVGPDYNDWGVKLEWQRGRFGAKLAFSDSDAGAECPDLCDARVTLILEISR